MLRKVRDFMTPRRGDKSTDAQDNPPQAMPVTPAPAVPAAPSMAAATAPAASAAPAKAAIPTTAAPAAALAPAVLEEELAMRAKAAAASLGEIAGALKGSKWVHALSTFDKVAAIVQGDIALPGEEASEPDPDIREMLLDARDDLLEAALAAASGRTKSACSSLRGVMEGLFSALLYRQQAISLNLWAANISFHMVHSLFEDRHEFFKYYQRLFADARFVNQYSGVNAKAVFKEAADLYDTLSAHVHKKKAAARDLKEATVDDLLERVFQIFLTFLEREDELPTGLTFPTPLTFAAKKSQPGTRAKR